MVLHRRSGSSSRRGRLTQSFRPLSALLEEDETDSNSATQRSSQQTTRSEARRVTFGATGLHPPPVRESSWRLRPLASTREYETHSY